MARKEPLVISNGHIEQLQLSDWVKADIFDIPITFEGVGEVIAVGKSAVKRVYYDCEILEWCIMTDNIGSIVIDIRKSTWAGYPPTASICGTNKPTVVNSNKAEGNVTGWTTAITAGEVLRFHVESVSNINQAVLVLKLRKV